MAKLADIVLSVAKKPNGNEVKRTQSHDSHQLEIPRSDSPVPLEQSNPFDRVLTQSPPTSPSRSRPSQPHGNSQHPPPKRRLTDASSRNLSSPETRNKPARRYSHSVNQFTSNSVPTTEPSSQQNSDGNNSNLRGPFSTEDVTRGLIEQRVKSSNSLNRQTSINFSKPNGPDESSTNANATPPSSPSRPAKPTHLRSNMLDILSKSSRPLSKEDKLALAKMHEETETSLPSSSVQLSDPQSQGLNLDRKVSTGHSMSMDKDKLNAASRWAALRQKLKGSADDKVSKDSLNKSLTGHELVMELTTGLLPVMMLKMACLDRDEHDRHRVPV